MERIIENQFLRVKVKDMGAELCELYNKKSDKHLLWNGDASWWNRSAPLLFPAIGKSKDGKYIYNKKTYEMTQHGFARDNEFTLVAQNDSSITHKLVPTINTSVLYPFNFELLVKHSLAANELKIEWTVINKDEVTMPFSIGGHAAFICAPVSGNFENSAMVFEKDALQYQMVDGPLVDNSKKYAMNLTNGILPITKELFEKDVLIFPDAQVQQISLTDNGKKHLTVKFTGFPFVGIWTKPGAPFVCIEPWYGVADSTDADQIIEHKRGIQLLPAGEQFKVSHSVVAE